MCIKIGDRFMQIVKDGENILIEVKRVDGNKVTCESFVNQDRELYFSISELNDTALFIKST